MDAVLLALIDTGIITREEAERINRTMDPEAARVWAERRIMEAWQAGLLGQQSRLIDVVRAGGRFDDQFWRNEDDVMARLILPVLAEVAIEAGSVAVIEFGIGGDVWNVVDETVLTWLNDYYTLPIPGQYGSIPMINQTSRQQFARVFERWNRGQISVDQGAGMEALINETATIFGPQRAEIIAVTESTRVFNESRLAAAFADPDLGYKRVYTAADEIVCPICGPVHGATIPLDGFFNLSNGDSQMSPPFHPRCRCSMVFMSAERRHDRATVDAFIYEA